MSVLWVEGLELGLDGPELIYDPHTRVIAIASYGEIYYYGQGGAINSSNMARVEKGTALEYATGEAVGTYKRTNSYHSFSYIYTDGVAHSFSIESPPILLVQAIDPLNGIYFIPGEKTVKAQDKRLCKFCRKTIHKDAAEYVKFNFITWITCYNCRLSLEAAIRVGNRRAKAKTGSSYLMCDFCNVLEDIPTHQYLVVNGIYKHCCLKCWRNCESAFNIKPHKGDQK